MLPSMMSVLTRIEAVHRDLMGHTGIDRCVVWREMFEILSVEIDEEKSSSYSPLCSFQPGKTDESLVVSSFKIHVQILEYPVDEEEFFKPWVSPREEKNRRFGCS